VIACPSVSLGFHELIIYRVSLGVVVLVFAFFIFSLPESGLWFFNLVVCDFELKVVILDWLAFILPSPSPHFVCL
jgi:hypothetical protein